MKCKDCKYFDEIIHMCMRYELFKDNLSYVFPNDECSYNESNVDKWANIIKAYRVPKRFI